SLAHRHPPPHSTLLPYTTLFRSNRTLAANRRGPTVPNVEAIRRSTFCLWAGDSQDVSVATIWACSSLTCPADRAAYVWGKSVLNTCANWTCRAPRVGESRRAKPTSAPRPLQRRVLATPREIGRAHV